ncbi:hypothetical protein M501DRAFT_1028790 [Patellaria atrata CBS 101060]|uniref:ABM domain-containing protein n=1 Tax=Patellaria atrata CBS 101060 TaxID=1346257 RepID=A0A9P4VVT3_9PEZI|nr:hypothetical protein M501DRAFT_1028790 [Patellaria atrata CBS 101060]
MFIIYGNLQFAPPNGYDEWVALYHDLEGYVRENEKATTLTYYFGTPEEYGKNHSRSTCMLAFEMYGKRDDLYVTHFNSSAMGTFLKKMPHTLMTGLDLMHYEDVGGYLDKYNDMRECEIFYDTRLKIKPEKCEEVLAKLVKLADWTKENEKDTYTFLVLKSLDNDHDVRIFERYATRTALEAHQQAKKVIDCFQSSKDLILSMEGRGYIPNGDGWLHR